MVPEASFPEVRERNERAAKDLEPRRTCSVDASHQVLAQNSEEARCVICVVLECRQVSPPIVDGCRRSARRPHS